MTDLRPHLRVLAEALPPGIVVPVLREVLLGLLAGATPESIAPDDEVGNRLLTVDEVATRLHLSREVVYRRARRWPFTRRIGRALRFSPTGLEAWLARQRP